MKPDGTDEMQVTHLACNQGRDVRPARPTSSPMAKESPPVKPLDDPDFIGAEAALKRASAKAVARARAAGLEPVVRTSHPMPEASSSSTDH